MTENMNNEIMANHDIKSDRELDYEESKLIIEDKVVAKIARIAINNVDGILEMKGNIADSIGSFFGSSDRRTAGVNVEVGQKEAKINLDVIIEYGKNARTIFNEIQKVVSQNIKEMTGLEVVTINVDVVDVLTKKEYQEKQQSSNDREK